jgi:uncharacterized membrane protein YkoI
MKKFIYAASVLGTLVSGFASYAEEVALKTTSEVSSIGKAYRTVKARDDYALMIRAYFNREDLVYEFAYKAEDGSTKEVVFDAVSGQVE